VTLMIHLISRSSPWWEEPPRSRGGVDASVLNDEPRGDFLGRRHHPRMKAGISDDLEV